MNRKASNISNFHSKGKRTWLACFKMAGIFLLFLLITTTHPISARNPVPVLSIPVQIPALPGGTVTVPVHFAANGNAISTVVFSVDYDEKLLNFDPTDSNGDGIPDSVTFNLTGGFQGSVQFNGDDTDGELDFMIADMSPPLSSLPDREVVTIRLNAGNPRNSVNARVGFSKDPKASFGSTTGKSVRGDTRDGSVHIKVKGK